MTRCTECHGRGYDEAQQEAYGVWAPCLACDDGEIRRGL